MYVCTYVAVITEEVEGMGLGLYIQECGVSSSVSSSVSHCEH